MGKILESEFRNNLYKGLLEAGYEKEEAQKIVGVKYYNELHKTVTHDVDSFLDSIVKEKYDVTMNVDDINGRVEELKKLKEIIE